MLEMQTRRYKLTGTTPMLGSQPASEAVRTQYIGSKAPSPAMTEEEAALIPELDEKGITVFMRDTKGNDALCMMDYMIRGFFKNAISAMEGQLGILQARAKVDKYLFVGPRIIYITREGEKIIDEDDQLERPLRAETMKGPRTALAASEKIDDPWNIEFEVALLTNKPTTKSKMLDFDAVESALDYGKYSGLGQWRNGGFGRFTWERVA